MKVLVTGFEPFGGESINPSYQAILAMKEDIAGAKVVKAELPTVFGRSIERLKELMAEHSPDVVICVGQAGGRAGVTPERVGINVDDARIPDNDGNSPVDQPIFNDGPAAYFSTLPIKAMVAKMREAGLPGAVSNTAGTYVCNHIAYGLGYLIERGFTGVRGGFIHVPYCTAQVTDKPNTPSMSLQDITRCLELAVEAAVTHDTDIKLSDSDTH